MLLGRQNTHMSGEILAQKSVTGRFNFQPSSDGIQSVTRINVNTKYSDKGLRIKRQLLLVSGSSITNCTQPVQSTLQPLTYAVRILETRNGRSVVILPPVAFDVLSQSGILLPDNLNPIFEIEVVALGQPRGTRCVQVNCTFRIVNVGLWVDTNAPPAKSRAELKGRPSSLPPGQSVVFARGI